jgi:Flp pilus assembly protein TadG
MIGNSPNALNALRAKLRLDARRLRSDRSGAVLLNFALASIPLMALTALAVDYSRALSAKQTLQQAVDSTVLAVAQDAISNPNSTATSRQTLASNKLHASIAAGDLANAVNALGNATFETEDGAGNYTVAVKNVKLNTTLMLAPVSALIGKVDYVTLNVSATATTSGSIGSNNTLEMALALDNTGSMVNDMAGLRSAASTLVNTVISAANGNVNGNVKISVVPYVAAVNPGISDLTMIDTSHVNPLNGSWFQGAWLAYNTGCVQNWAPGGAGPGSGSTGDAGSMIDMMELVSPFRRIAEELFLTKSAKAQTAAPPSPALTISTTPPYSTTAWASPFKNADGKTKTINYLLPKAFQGVAQNGASTGFCAWLANPATVNTYELFARTLNPSGTPVAWKGCVEARLGRNEISRINTLWGASYTASSDYDVTDYPPTSGDNLSLFVPYFAPDESDYNYNSWAYSAPGATGTGKFHNNYLPDLMIQSSWIANYGNTSFASGNANNWGWTYNQWGGGQNLLNYNAQNKAAIVAESGGAWTYGPNAYCPDPILRLTTSSTSVLSKINNMNFWYGGGTIASEGLAWAWRTLSPSKPFVDGKAYGTANNKKVIVLMTDGVNGLAENGNANGAPESDFNAYGYLGHYRYQALANVPTATTGTELNPPIAVLTPKVDYGGVTTYDAAQTFLDDRLIKACANAKAQGITIYTVLFNHTGGLTAAQQAHSLGLLQKCASNVNYTYLAADTDALNSAFAKIGNSVTGARVRLKL